MAELMVGISASVINMKGVDFVLYNSCILLKYKVGSTIDEEDIMSEIFGSLSVLT